MSRPSPGLPEFPTDGFNFLRGGKGLRLWTASGLDLPRRLQPILRALERPPTDEGEVETLKQSERRSVLRVRGLSATMPSLIVKGFPLRKIESRLKYRKYGLTEFLNCQEANRRLIPAPRCCGYFEVRSFGTVRANGVLLEDLCGWPTLAQAIAAEPARRWEILGWAIPMLGLLYKAGVNHIDPSPQNILHAPDPNTQELRMVDWQYCSFVPPRQPVQLILHAAHFLTYAEVPADSPEAQAWLLRLHASSKCPCSSDAFLRAVLRCRARGKIPATDRLALRLDRETLAVLAQG